MYLKFVVILGSVFMLLQQCTSLNLINILDTQEKIEEKSITKDNSIPIQDNLPLDNVNSFNETRRGFIYNKDKRTDGRKDSKALKTYEDEKDENLKVKISTLVEQTIHDTERKIHSVDYLKERYREQPSYKAGFILSMVKKSRDVLNELFNVAVKHRDEWKALEQLKIFELIVHTNVDTTNLVRQLVEIHIQNLNETGGPIKKKRVVLL